MTEKGMENMTMPQKPADIHKGHRQRMRAKLIRNSDKAFDTYELLEMLLYHVIPYKDTNPVSKNLLSRFGSLEGVLSAKKEELTEIPGVGERVSELILSVGRFASLMNAEECGDHGIVLDNYKAAGVYAVEYLKPYSTPCVALIMLDNRMRLISTKIVCEKKYESAGVRASMFLDPAIENKASVVMTAELKPYGPLFPTVGDMETSKMLADALSAVGILHIEHYVASGGSFVGTVSKDKFKVGQTAEIANFIKTREEYLENDRF